MRWLARLRLHRKIEIAALAIGGATAILGWATCCLGEESLSLTWGDCVSSAAATANVSSACDTELGERSLYAAFTLAYPLDSVVALEVVIDIQTSGAALPPWWEFTATGCRPGGLLASTSFPTGSPCTNFWQGKASQVLSYYPGEPRGGAGQARVKIALAVLPDQYRRLEASVVYDAVRLKLQNQGTATCTGCATAACLVLNSILVGRLPGAPGGDVLLQNPGANPRNHATWQGGSGNCDAVPIRTSTWGQIKSLYR